VGCFQAKQRFRLLNMKDHLQERMLELPVALGYARALQWLVVSAGRWVV
jgi:hypothetical protein